MEETSGAAGLTQAKPNAGPSILWQPIRFFLHLAVVYFIAKYTVPWLSAWTRGSLLPSLGQPTRSSGLEFLFSHLFAFSFIPAFVAALVNARFKHRVAWFVWTVPAAILAYKFVTFPVPSSILAPASFQSQIQAAWHQYFAGGFLLADFRDWRDFWALVGSNSDIVRGLAQINFTAPFYAGIGYSLAAWFAQRVGLGEKLSATIKSWEGSRFGNSESEERNDGLTRTASGERDSAPSTAEAAGKS